MNDRRHFFKAAGAVALGASAVSRVAAAALPEAVTQTSPAMQPPLVPPNGRPYRPVATLNGWSLPWRMKDGVKEYARSRRRRLPGAPLRRPGGGSGG